MRTYFAAALVALGPVASMGCGVTTDSTSPVVVSIRLQPAAANLSTGETRQLTATLLDGSGHEVTSRAVTWASAAQAVATVSQTGLVTAVGPGQALITSSVDHATATAVITVSGRVASIEVTPSQATGDVFGTLQLTATVRDANGTVLLGWPVYWTSGDPSIVGISDDGLLTLASVGSANVFATSEGRIGSATITVIRLPVEAVSVSPSPVSIITNRVLQLNATVLGPSGKVLLGRPIAWSSSDPSVASVSGTGLVTSYRPGDATITATVEGHAAQAVLKVITLSFSSVTLGDGHTCGVLGTGTAYCWGDNTSGQLGSVSNEICGDPWYDGTWDCNTAPAAVAGGVSFVELTAGAVHTCGLSPEGKAYCWGSNSWGALGLGPVNSGSMPPFAVVGGLTFATLTAGDKFTCGVTIGAAAYCWGYNASGQLGDGTINHRTAPVAVLGGLSFRLLSAGRDHTCGITTAAKLYCWGANYGGQLGDGTLDQSGVPVAVVGNLPVSAVQTGDAHTCALTAAGQAWCWGQNSSGALGIGSLVSSSIPEAVIGSGQWNSIAAGGGFTCGISSDGKAYCWGDNDAGQLGEGTTSLRTTPSLVAGGLEFAALSAGQSHTCGRTTAGILFCWGAGWSGQLGTGGTDGRLNPGRVLGQP